MGHRTLINGTAYGIEGGRALVNGTGYRILRGRTLVGGTVYPIDLGTSSIVATHETIYSTSASNQIATFTNLGNGSYRFRVRATRSSNVEQDRTIVRIIVPISPYYSGKTLSADVVFSSSQYPGQYSYSDMSIVYGSSWTALWSDSGTVSLTISYNGARDAWIMLSNGTNGTHDYECTISNIRLGGKTVQVT